MEKGAHQGIASSLGQRVMDSIPSGGRLFFPISSADRRGNE